MKKQNGLIRLTKKGIAYFAVFWAIVGLIVYGVPDPRAGACGSLVNLPAYPLEERPSCLGGVREEECRTLLRDFFSELRKKRKNKT